MGGKVLIVPIDIIREEGREHILYNASNENYIELAAGVYAKKQGDAVKIFVDCRVLSKVL